MNIVSDIAFGPHGSKPGDEKPNLDDVLTELEVSERESDDLPIVHLYDAVETNTPVQTKPPIQANTPVETNKPEVSAEAAPEVDDALRRADQHRQRLEQLLDDARRIEELLTKEAAEARALAEKVNLEEKRSTAARAAALEQQATTKANTAAQRRDAAVRDLTQFSADVRSSREAVEAAANSVADLQARFAEAQKLVIQTKLKLRENETRAERAARLAEETEAEARAAAAQAAKFRQERKTAEAEFRQAEKIAGSVALTAVTLERIRNLSGAERVAKNQSAQ